MTRALFDTFDAPAMPACGGGTVGGVIEESATVSRDASGVLVVAPIPSMGTTRGGCSWEPYSLPADGAIIEIVEPLHVLAAYTQFKVAALGGTTSVGIQLAQSDLYAIVDDNAVEDSKLSWDPIAMRWWRLVPVQNLIAAEVSRDATNWRRLGAYDLGAPTTGIDIKFVAGTIADVPAPGKASFDNFNACPPVR